MSQAITYRPEIDGLRAIAVLPVVLFHSGIDFFSGGFVGVNVFFVISGYLITKIIYSETKNGTFTITRFYQKRLDRLLPVLLVVLLFVAGAAYFTSPPQELSSISKSILAALTFTSNIFFWLESDYFAASAFTLPLLHTWSLGIEEQFYIFFPLFLILTYRLRIHKLAVAAAAITSFAIALYFIKTSPPATFYLLPSRAWELLLGSILALNFLPRLNSTTVSNLISAAGLILISASVLMLSKSSVFPGVNALPPTIGAMLIIYGTSHPQNLIKRLLSLKALTLTGKASYSIYMWHWPIIVFYGLTYGYPTTTAAKLILAATTIAAGFISWRLIEHRTRGKLSKLAPAKTFSISFVACAPLIIFGLASAVYKGLPQRVEPEVIASENMATDFSEFRNSCHTSPSRGNDRNYDDYCVLGDPASTPSIAVWGDSHGVEIAAALGEVIQQEKMSLKQITYSACPPLSGIAKAKRPGCSAHNEAILSSLQNDESITTVVLTMYYPSDKHWSNEYTQGLAETVEALSSTQKQVIVMSPLPQTIDGAPSMIARNIMLGRSSYISQSTDFFLQDHSEAFAALNSLNAPGLTKLETWKLFCNQNCFLGDAKGSFFFDAHHPSMHAARMIAKKIAPLIDQPSIASNRSLAN